MKHTAQRITLLLTVLFLTMSFTSCEDEDDWYAEEVICGTWRINEVELYGGECPYYEGDRMEFFSDGEFRVYGYNGFYEEGRWDVHNGRLYFDFGFDGTDDMVAELPVLDYGFMRLDVTDYYYHSHYTLRLTKR